MSHIDELDEFEAQLELVAEVRGVLGEHAPAEQLEDIGVLPLQPELELRLELVKLVDVRHSGSF